jgi:saccharopine dehydrogenase-like NADP-dependent oxidoreductase
VTRRSGGKQAVTISPASARPGLTNAGQKGTVAGTREAINVSWFGGADDAGGYANYRHAVHIFCGKVPSFQGGREVPVKAGSGREVIDFPAPCGPLPVYHTGHAEPVTIPQSIPGLDEVTLKGDIWPNWLARAGILLERAGMIRGERSQKFWADLFYRVLPRLPRGKCRVSGFRVDVWGEKGDEKAHAWYAGVNRMNRITSIPAALAHYGRQGEVGEQESSRRRSRPDVCFRA